MEELTILMKIWTFVKPYFSWFLKKKKIEELNILFIDDEHDEFDIIKTLRDSREY